MLAKAFAKVLEKPAYAHPVCGTLANRHNIEYSKLCDNNISKPRHITQYLWGKRMSISKTHIPLLGSEKKGYTEDTAMIIDPRNSQVDSKSLHASNVEDAPEQSGALWRTPIPQWWGTYSLEEGQAGRWKLGPATAIVYRLHYEWRVTHQLGDDAFDDSIEIEVPFTTEPPGTDISVRRYMFRETTPELTITPKLADRPVIIRPENPFAIQANEEINLYVTTPLWMSISASQMGQPLREVPSIRIADTWFGSSTIRGELCYASRMTAQLELNELLRLSYRALTPLRIRNRDDKPLLLERLKLPVQYLALYSDQDNSLWTQAILLEQHRGNTRLTVRRGAPNEVRQTATRVSSSRSQPPRGLILRAFEHFFHDKQQEEA